MGDEKSKTPLLPFSTIFVALAAIGVTLFTQPFEGARPPEPDNRKYIARVNARLWQDPFDAVLKSRNLGSLTPPTIDISSGNGKPARKTWSDANCRFKLTDAMSEGKLTVLGVMVPGGPYFEDGESRMRYRHAVLSGLGRLRYVPDDSEYIEFAKVLSDSAPKDGYHLANIMPMELFSSSMPGSGNLILILWMNDSVFREEPLTKIGRIARYFSVSTKSGDNRFALIGPANSDSLREMVRDAWGPANAPRQSSFTDTSEITHTSDLTPTFRLPYRIYSAMATTDDLGLLKYAESTTHKAGEQRSQPASEGDAGRAIEDKFGKRGFRLERTIGSDRQLARALIKELKLRKVDLMDPGTRVLLVAEWDTYYGRSFEESFAAEFREALRDDLRVKRVSPEGADRLNSADVGGRVRRLSYLRGIDGKLPGGADEKRARDDNKDIAKDDAAKTPKKFEQPVGTNQQDYLRRLSEEIYGLDEELRHDKKGEIKVIGVMGTDFYDKHLVLQALRQKFPDAVYFTTDMDARLLNRDNLKWTRNVVVASNFGLSLRKDSTVDVQGEIPPFRDNYQTSIYYTVLKAFSGEICNLETANCQEVRNLVESFDSRRKPMIFEVGHNRAVLLTDPGETIHPKRGRIYTGTWRPPVLILLGALFLLLTCTALNRLYKGFLGASTGRKILSAVALILAASVVPAILYLSSFEGEEPFSLFGGISVWPTELLRLIAILLSCFLFYRAYNSRRESTRKIIEDFHFDRVSPEKMTLGNFFGRLRNLVCPQVWTMKGAKDWFSAVLDCGWGFDKPEGSGRPVCARYTPVESAEPGQRPIPTLEGLWRKYRARDTGWHRFWRVTIVSVLYLLFCWTIISFDKPMSPVRGRISASIDAFMLAACVISFVVLICYVFDVTACCRRFILLTSEAFAGRKIDFEEDNVSAGIKENMDLIRLFAVRTAVIGRFVLYPFVVWLIMVFSRFEYFDNWRLPVSLAVVLSLAAIFTWASAILLRLDAEKARTRIVESLTRLQTDLLFEGRKPGPPIMRQIAYTIHEIKSIREGAFAPLSQHPVLHVIMVVSGGLGGMFGLDLLSRFGV